MFNLRQLAKRIANIPFQGKCNPTQSSFGTSNVSKMDDKGTKRADRNLFDDPDDRNLPRVVDIDMETMMEDIDEDPYNANDSELILPDDVKPEIITAPGGHMHKHTRVFTASSDDRNLSMVVKIDMDAMMEDDPHTPSNSGVEVPKAEKTKSVTLTSNSMVSLSLPENNPKAAEIRNLLLRALDEQKKQFLRKIGGTPIDEADIKLPKPVVPEE